MRNARVSEWVWVQRPLTGTEKNLVFIISQSWQIFHFVKWEAIGCLLKNNLKRNHKNFICTNLYDLTFSGFFQSLSYYIHFSVNKSVVSDARGMSAGYVFIDYIFRGVQKDAFHCFYFRVSHFYATHGYFIFWGSSSMILVGMEFKGFDTNCKEFSLGSSGIFSDFSKM